MVFSGLTISAASLGKDLLESALSSGLTGLPVAFLTLPPGPDRDAAFRKWMLQVGLPGLGLFLGGRFLKSHANGVILNSSKFDVSFLRAVNGVVVLWFFW